MKKVVLSCVCLWMVMLAWGQGSADSRVCNCFTQAVASDFLRSTRAVYGRIGLVLSAGMEIKPAQAEPVRFTLPVLPSKATCRSWYTIYVTDSLGAKVHEQTGNSNILDYTFPSCGQRYEVTLMAYSRSEAGSDGNCSRRLRFSVRPVCSTVSCECGLQKEKATVSADFTLSGKLECLSPIGGQRRYNLRLDIINKSDCVLNIQSITVHGQTISVPAYNTAPRTETRGVNLGFTTQKTQSPPADAKVNLVIRYTLNNRKCSAVQELSYQPCQ